jgi:succinoglycan biosynthesis transport protein ExoP
LRAILSDPPALLRDSLWNLRLHLDRSRGDKDRTAVAVGFVSAMSGEGASTLAANFAQSLAASGERVILLDLDPDARELSAALCTTDTDAPGAFPLRDPSTGLLFRPAPEGAGDPYGALKEARARIRDALSSADYVILDLPPVLSRRRRTG